MNSNEQLFLWDIISLCWLKSAPQHAHELASSIYENPFNLSIGLEAIVVDFWANCDEQIIAELALLVVKGYFLNIEQHVVLVALLVEKKLLTINEAALLFKDSEGRYICDLSPKIQDVIDVAWLINEDADYGFMQPDEDDLLLNSLQELLVFIRINKNVLTR
ncbi:MAG: hypothetical protein PHP00_14745 [Thiotrichaceae bacterium]|nr:hypothetical protein [Thiotrichaceae bacterium]